MTHLSGNAPEDSMMLTNPKPNTGPPMRRNVDA